MKNICSLFFRYEEKNYYNYTTGLTKDPREHIEHFTQIVWKSTTKVGVGMSSIQNEDGSIQTIVIAKYQRPGNMQGQFTSEVELPKDDGKSD